MMTDDKLLSLIEDLMSLITNHETLLKKRNLVSLIR